MSERLAVICRDTGLLPASLALAERLRLPLLDLQESSSPPVQEFFLCYRDGCLKLLDKQTLNKGGLAVEIEPRPGEQHSYPAPKKDILAVAIGRKTKTVLDATTGWARDSLTIFRMGYDVLCIERSPLMAELIRDGFDRLAAKDWMVKRGLPPPKLLEGDSIALLAALPEKPDCIYLDPMFPPKRKKSALAKKSMSVLHEILGGDEDRAELFAAAWRACGKRLVVKSPDYAEPLGGKPSEVFQGKLLRYDVYIK